MTRHSFSAKFWWIGLLSFVFLASAIYLIIIRGEKSSPAEELYVQEATIARAEVSNIQSYFEAIGNSTVILAKSPSVEIGSTSAVKVLETFLDQWRDSGIVAGVLLTDNKGVVDYNVNIKGTPDIGISLSDREYFIWAKDRPSEGEYFIGEPVKSRLGASKDKIIIPVASPVFTKGVFSGVVTTAVKLDSLTQHFLDLMKVSNQTNVYLVDGEKNLLYRSANSHELSDGIKNKIKFGVEGRFETGSLLVVYSPVKLGAQSWVLVVASPVNEIISLDVPYYVRQIAILLLVSLFTFIFGIIVSLEGQKRL